MRCGLKDLVGFPATCEKERCVYWRDADPAHGTTEPGCVLEEFGLTGSVADRLTRWLLQYKFSADRARVIAAMSAHRELAARRSCESIVPTRPRPIVTQNSPSCPRRTSVA